MSSVTVCITVSTEDEPDYVGQIVYDALRSMYTTVSIPVDENGEDLEVLDDPIWSLENLVEAE